MAKQRKFPTEEEIAEDMKKRWEQPVRTSPLLAQLFNVPGESSERLATVRLEQIEDFPHHPYKVHNDEKMMELRDSIKANGILEPIILWERPQSQKLVCLAGHRRRMAAELAGMSDIPAIIKSGLTDDQATIIMVDSNHQREVILPSERAFAIYMKNEALKHQGKVAQQDEQLLPPGGKSQNVKKAPYTSQIIAQEEGIGKSTVIKYIRLTKLIPELLDLVDNSVVKDKSLPEMAIKPAVEISYLTPDQQQYFYDTVKTLNKTPSVQQARMIKDMSARNELTQTEVMRVLIEDKPNQKETIKLDSDALRGYFNGSYTPSQLQAKVTERLDSYERIDNVIKKHTGRNAEMLTEDDKVKIIEVALKEYVLAKNKQDNNKDR